MKPVSQSYYDYAFFSAFTTVNNFQRTNNFFNSEIEPIFSEYRKALNIIREDRDTKSKLEAINDPCLFKPVAYSLFGDFDLAIFSLIDDFSFATKKFKPSSKTDVFKYQVNTGIIPLIQAYSNKPFLDIFVSEKLPNFFLGKEAYPFTGIVSLKFDNSMIVGLGQDFIELLNYFLISYIDNKTDFIEKKGEKLFYIINENLGWNEISIYFFSNSISTIQNLILEVRSFNLRRIKEYIESLPISKGYDLEKAKKFTKIIIPSIGKKSLLSNLISNKLKYDYLESFPILASSVTFGYHADLAILTKPQIRRKFNFNEKQLLRFENEAKKKTITIGWKIKPGHEIEADKLLGKLFLSNKGSAFENVLSGKYSFRFPNDRISLIDYLKMDKKLSNQVLCKELGEHITKFRSRIRIQPNVNYFPINKAKLFSPDLTKYQLSKSLIQTIQGALRIYPIPYTFKNQIENLIINFNDGISDPLMYNYFIGLRGSLLNFLKQHFQTPLYNTKSKTGMAIKAYSNYFDNSEVYDESLPKSGEDDNSIKPRSVEISNISLFIQTWNKAYWNRYFHSYYFTEINDFNIEHHGGIQQILITYDVMYKLMSKRIFGKRCKRPFLNVQVGPIISSSQYYNTVNFVHLFFPAIYACECVHEVANYVIPFLIEEGHDEFDILMNPQSEMIKPDRLEKLEKLEEAIYKQLNPRDSFEITYIKERFGLNVSRQIAADFITFKIAYQNDNDGTAPADIDTAIRFYKTHWFLFLLRADLYARDSNGHGAWFFVEDEFKSLFIRFNLMFCLCFDYNEEQLKALNMECPSVELKPFWESEYQNLIDFVLRLAKAFKKELKNHLKFEGSDITGFDLFINTIKTSVIRGGWTAITSEERGWCKNVFDYNNVLIEEFSKYFVWQANDTSYNIIKRLAKNKVRKKSKFSSNVDFFKDTEERQIFLDPKGNIFTITPTIRKKIYASNINYIKSMWDLALKAMKEDYVANPYV